MNRLNRRDLLKTTIAGGFFAGMEPKRSVRAASANSEIRLAIIGLGGIDVPGGVGGRGRQLIRALQPLSQARVVSLCDVDEEILAHGVNLLSKSGQKVSAHSDMRRVFDDANVDAVLIATPNHWHALATVWGCQAGKDVYVEKPFSHNIWEGRQMIAAARHHKRIVQVGTQRRSGTLLPNVFEAIHSGAMGPLRSVHAIIYRPRPGIGSVSSPTPIPKHLDYNLWCGPIRQSPVMRPELHYQWHWFWETGNGEIGNNGVHTIDLARWALADPHAPQRVMSIGGRFGKPDCAETANTHLAFLEFEKAPIICEIRNLGNHKDGTSGRYRNLGRGIVIDCEGGHCVAQDSAAVFLDRQGKTIREFRSEQTGADMINAHLENFLSAVESRDSSRLKAEAVEGHLSAICVHAANISYRLGNVAGPDTIRSALDENQERLDAFERCSDHLHRNGVDLRRTQATLGPSLRLSRDREAFVGEFAEQANSLSRRRYREPFVVPEIPSRGITP